MITILEVLLYLSLINPGGTYTTSQINTLYQNNNETIISIENDANQMSSIDMQYNVPATQITIKDQGEEP